MTVKNTFEFERVERKADDTWYQYLGNKLYAIVFGPPPRDEAVASNPTRYAKMPSMNPADKAAFAAELTGPLLARLDDFRAVYIGEILDAQTRRGSLRHLRARQRLHQIQILQESLGEGLSEKSAIKVANTVLRFHGITEEESSATESASPVVAVEPLAPFSPPAASAPAEADPSLQSLDH